MTSRRYTLLLLMVVAAIVIGCALLNRVVDPFGYYRDFEIEGWNREKPRFVRSVREVKPQLLRRIQPEAIVIGSSLSEIGFDATDPAFTENGRLRGYNFAFAGASWDLQQCHLRYALQSTKLKRVVVGIRPGSLPLADCDSALRDMADFSELPLLFSLQTLRQSVATIREQQPGSSSHTSDGRYKYARGAIGVLDRFHEYYRTLTRSESRCLPEHFSMPATRIPGPLSRSDAGGSINLEGLRWMIQEARKQGIALRIFAYPVHAAWLELDYLCGDPHARWLALQAVARLVEQESHGADIHLWSFYAYREPMTEPVSSGRSVYWQDPEHFNFELGSMMLRDMFGPSANGALGDRLQPDTLSDVFGQFDARRKNFYDANPGYLDELRRIYAK